MPTRRKHEPFFAPKRNLFSDPKIGLFAKNKFRIVDGGADGAMFAPFDATPKDIHVYTFEPRGTTSQRPHQHTVIEGGIWSEEATQELHVAKVPSTSSIYPPNMELLTYFDDRYGAPPRTTEKRVPIELISIDAAVSRGKMRPPNFIKLDVHSAEYEALQGARNSLDECLGVLVEVWHLDIHKGQKLSSAVDSFLNENGFLLFSGRHMMSWLHSWKGQVLASDRPHTVGAENLYLRWDPPAHLLAAHIALLELFGFSALARRRLDEEYISLPSNLQARMAATLDANIAEREVEEAEAARLKRLEKKRFKEFLVERETLKS